MYKYVCYSDTINRIREAVSGKKKKISVDAVFIGSTMGYDQLSKIYLFTYEQLGKTNSLTVVQVFTSALNVQWLDGIKYYNISLFIFDVVAYMKKAGKVLKTCSSICFIHKPHQNMQLRIGEEICGLFSKCFDIFYKNSDQDSVIQSCPWTSLRKDIKHW